MPLGPASRCRTIEIPTIQDSRGNISILEGAEILPFTVKRVYVLHNLVENQDRGSHAHKKLHQIITVTTGSLVVNLDDGLSKKSFKLDKPTIALYLCPMVWRTLTDIAANTTAFVLASEMYDENDYFRVYEDFYAAALGKAHS